MDLDLGLDMGNGHYIIIQSYHFCQLICSGKLTVFWRICTGIILDQKYPNRDLFQTESRIKRGTLQAQGPGTGTSLPIPLDVSARKPLPPPFFNILRTPLIFPYSGPILAGVQRVHRTRVTKARGGSRPYIVLSTKQKFLRISQTET
ncbi:hypothetical protein TNCV_1510671 [Trichonephila clavipes]|nr:hypothetical protein TNCV_1510671 [Trichonephila clavipes]